MTCKASRHCGVYGLFDMHSFRVLLSLQTVWHAKFQGTIESTYCLACTVLKCCGVYRLLDMHGFKVLSSLLTFTCKISRYCWVYRLFDMQDFNILLSLIFCFTCKVVRHCQGLQLFFGQGSKVLWSVPAFHRYFCVSVALGNAISEAHLRTCLYSSEQIEALKQQTAPHDLVAAYSAMVCICSLV